MDLEAQIENKTFKPINIDNWTLRTLKEIIEVNSINNE